MGFQGADGGWLLARDGERWMAFFSVSFVLGRVVCRLLVERHGEGDGGKR